MKQCECKEAHKTRRVVLTGGPGAGKTAVLEMIRQSFCEHIKILPEAAGIIFGGGFPRNRNPEAQRAAQRAIFFVQRELEIAADAANAAVVLCDRGTIDGAAYWPGPGELWSAVGTTLDEQLRRYDAVIHLRTPDVENYNKKNPLRIESATEALATDARIAQLWSRHQALFTVDASQDFLDKAITVVNLLRDQMPECCRTHQIPALAQHRDTPAAASAHVHSDTDIAERCNV
jgi:predicted ATPase